MLNDFNYLFLAHMFYLRYEKPEIRPHKDMRTYTGTKFKFRCQINMALTSLKYRIIIPKAAQCTL